MRGAVAWR